MDAIDTNVLIWGGRTRREISESLGRGDAPQRKLLQTSRGAGSVLANLCRRGLVQKSKGRPVSGQGKGRSWCQYSLTLHAIHYHVRATRRKLVG